VQAHLGLGVERGKRSWGGKQSGKRHAGSGHWLTVEVDRFRANQPR
jgi:hypothetical protein